MRNLPSPCENGFEVKVSCHPQPPSKMHLDPPPTKCTISSRSPSARSVRAHWSRGTISRFNSTATRSVFIPSSSTSPCSVSGPSNVRFSPLITMFIPADLRKDSKFCASARRKGQARTPTTLWIQEMKKQMEKIGLPGGLLNLTEPEFSGGRPPRIAGLHQHRGVGQGGFVQVHFHFGVAARIREYLGIKRHRTRTLEAED
jgi:hypothetical protein